LYTSRTPAERLQITSGAFQANAAWLALACLAFNLLHAAGAAASARHTKARWATLRTHLITVPARIAYSARRLVLHLPTDWPWAPAWQDSGPPQPHPDHLGPNRPPRNHPTWKNRTDRPINHAHKPNKKKSSAEITNRHPGNQPLNRPDMSGDSSV